MGCTTSVPKSGDVKKTPEAAAPISGEPLNTPPPPAAAAAAAVATAAATTTTSTTMGAAATGTSNEAKPTFGIFLNSNSTTVAAQVAELYDFILIDCQHSPVNSKKLSAMIAAVQGGNAKCMVRVGGSNDRAGIQQALDLGADGILVPYVNTAEEVVHAVSCCRYPTAGTRSVYFPQRSMNKNGLLSYVGNANKSITIAIQIETSDSIKNIDAIASVEGVSMLFLGQNDLCMSMGLYEKYEYPKMYTSDELNQATEKLIAACKKNNRVLGIFLFGTDRVGEFLRKGFTYFSIGNDLHHLMTQAQAHHKVLLQVKAELSGASTSVGAVAGASAPPAEKKALVPMSFSIARNSHEVLRMTHAKVLQIKLNEKDLSGFMQEWTVMLRFLQIHAKWEDLFFPVLVGAVGDASSEPASVFSAEHARDQELSGKVTQAKTLEECQTAYAAWWAFMSDHLVHEEKHNMPLTQKTGATPKDRAKYFHDHVICHLQPEADRQWYIAHMIKTLTATGTTLENAQTGVRVVAHGLQGCSTDEEWKVYSKIVKENTSKEIWDYMVAEIPNFETKGGL